VSELAHIATFCCLSANTGAAAVLLISSSNTVRTGSVTPSAAAETVHLMVLIVGTLLAWAVSLRLISDALFAALGAYLHIWATVLLGTLGMLAHVLGLYRPQAHISSQVWFKFCMMNVHVVSLQPIRFRL
jgi:hypothetical protein